MAQRGGARGIMTGSGKWTPVKGDLVTVVAHHVQNRPTVEYAVEEWLPLVSNATFNRFEAQIWS
jgi:hypothetical protein